MAARRSCHGNPRRGDAGAAGGAARRLSRFPCFFFSGRRRHTRCLSAWSSDVCSSDLVGAKEGTALSGRRTGGHGGDCACARRTSQSENQRQTLRRPAACVKRETLSGQPAWRNVMLGRASCRERVWRSEGGGGGEKRKE